MKRGLETILSLNCVVSGFVEIVVKYQCVLILVSCLYSLFVLEYEETSGDHLVSGLVRGVHVKHQSVSSMIGIFIKTSL